MPLHRPRCSSRLRKRPRADSSSGSEGGAPPQPHPMEGGRKRRAHRSPAVEPLVEEPPEAEEPLVAEDAAAAEEPLAAEEAAAAEEPLAAEEAAAAEEPLAAEEAAAAEEPLAAAEAVPDVPAHGRAAKRAKLSVGQATGLLLMVVDTQAWHAPHGTGSTVWGALCHRMNVSHPNLNLDEDRAKRVVRTLEKQLRAGTWKVPPGCSPQLAKEFHAAGAVYLKYRDSAAKQKQGEAARVAVDQQQQQLAHDFLRAQVQLRGPVQRHPGAEVQYDGDELLDSGEDEVAAEAAEAAVARRMGAAPARPRAPAAGAVQPNTASSSTPRQRTKHDVATMMSNSIAALDRSANARADKRGEQVAEIITQQARMIALQEQADARDDVRARIQRLTDRIALFSRLDRDTATLEAQLDALLAE